MLILEAKVVAQRFVKVLENKRSEKRMKLYHVHDEVDEKNETLLSTIIRCWPRKSVKKRCLR